MKTFPNVLVWTVSLLAIVPQTIAAALADLRILPLGDSITKGSLSSDGNGYRNYLEAKLRNIDSDSPTHVDMIGTLHGGTMTDNDHEGHSGEFVENIVTYWQKPFTAGPNVVLILVGTNNMDLDRNVAEAPGLYSTMLDEMYKTLPDAFIIVCKVIHSKSADLNARATVFNAKLEDIVQQRSAAGRPIVIIDMGLVDSDIKDSKHPTDLGYAKLANGWYQAIIHAHDSGLIKPHGTSKPTGVGVGVVGNNDAPSGTAGCDGGNWKRVGKVFDDFHVWEEHGSIKGRADDFAYDKLILADLDGDGFDDYILADYDGRVRAWKNNGGGMTSLGYIQPDWTDLNITGEMVRMADVTGDGKADMIALYSDGAAKVWKNTGDGTKFEALDSKWATGLGSREKIRILDMDGDGYADYVVLYDGGAVSWARNTHNNGADRSKPNWERLVEIAPGVAGIPPKSVHLIDLDGDKRADYVIIYDGGAVKALRNSGNLNKDANRRNWYDLGTIAPGVSGTTGEMIRFADMNGDGLADFLSIAKDGSVRMWSNQGLVGADVTNLRFADLTGNGRADLIYVDAVGRAVAWINGGLGTWQKVGRIATIRADEDLSDSSIHFADVNGDGLADYLIVYGGGAVKAWLNNGHMGRQDGQRLWTGPYVIAPGVAENDDGGKVRFADLNGDGFADYLVLYDGGAVDAWLNQQQIPPNGRPIWRDKETVATGVGEPGSKIRFVQLNNDGKAEYVVQYDGGAAKAYLNTGDIPGSPNIVNWIDIGVVAAGVSEPGPVFYADIDGDGKDDYLVRYSDGSINAWVNICEWKVGPGGIFTPGPGDGNGDEGWRNVRCSDGSIEDQNAPRAKRWSDAQADQAMTDAFRYWNANPPGHGTNVEFSMEIAGFFQKGSGLSASMHCNAMLDENGCHSDATPDCSDGKDGLSPAGWLILTSMLSINSNYWNIFDAIDGEATKVFADVPKLKSTFDPPPPTDQTAELILNLLQQTWTVFAAPNLIKVFKGTSLQNNTLLSPAIGAGFSWIMTQLNQNPKYIDGTQDLQAQVTLIANLWLIGMEGVGNATFNGSANSIHNLVGLIAEGVYLNPALVGAVEMRAQIEKPIYAIMIPATWNYNDNPAQGSKAVFILSTEYDCKNSEECPERPPGYPSGLDSFMTSDAAQQTCYCYGGKWFFLLQVKGYAYTCGFGIGSNCNDPNKLVAPKGLDAFDGKSWGGLTKHHLVQGSINTWVANGRKNGYAIDFGDPDVVGMFTGENSIEAPGAISIPVCGLEEAYDNWNDNAKAKHFPCN